VVPSLLACLCSPLREVRRAAVAVLDQLSEATESSFQPLITRLLKNTEEIIADPSHLSQVRRQRQNAHRHETANCYVHILKSNAS
jgi:hypothetical protein